jgi:hypothetical protein
MTHKTKLYKVHIQGQPRPYITLDKDRAYDMRRTAILAKKHVVISEVKHDIYVSNPAI